MKKSIALISLFVVLMIAFSGCMGDNTPAANGTNPGNPKANVISGENTSDLCKIKNLPAGFEFVGNPQLSIGDIKSSYKAENVSGILGGCEGLYKGSNNTDYVLDVIQFENKEATNDFISTYKSSLKPQNVAEESFNGHSAVRVTNHITIQGQSIPRYSYIWNNENYVMVVSGNTDDSSLVKQLAEATGY